jgi:hypothetical protein
MVTARVHLEALLRERKLDRTLMARVGAEERRIAATGVATLDAQLGGGLPRGEVSEIAGPASTGRSTLLCRILTAAAHRGEAVGLVDALDRFDPETAEQCGLILSRLLWVRGVAAVHPTQALRELAIDKALNAFNLVLRCGNFGVVALDIADLPPTALRHIPFTTWMRFQRIVENSSTVCLVVAPQPVGRSARGVTLLLERRPVAKWSGASARSRLFCGFDLDVRVVGR